MIRSSSSSAPPAIRWYHIPMSSAVSLLILTNCNFNLTIMMSICVWSVFREEMRENRSLVIIWNDTIVIRKARLNQASDVIWRRVELTTSARWLDGAGVKERDGNRVTLKTVLISYQFQACLPLYPSSTEFAYYSWPALNCGSIYGWWMDGWGSPAELWVNASKFDSRAPPGP